MSEALIRVQDKRIAALEAENDTLREHVRQLSATIAGDNDKPLPREWGLTPAEERIVMALTRAEVATKERLLDVVHNGRPEDEPAIKIIDVFMCKIRKKLAPYDVSITTIWGRGYMMPAASKRKIAEACRN